MQELFTKLIIINRLHYSVRTVRLSFVNIPNTNTHKCRQFLGVQRRRKINGYCKMLVPSSGRIRDFEVVRRVEPCYVKNSAIQIDYCDTLDEMIEVG